MISWAALNHQWRGLKTPPKKRAAVELPEAKRWHALRARLRKVMRRRRRDNPLTAHLQPSFEQLRRTLAKLGRVG